VVTLIPAPGMICKGVAYLVEPRVFEHLDHREKNGYTRFSTGISFARSDQCVDGVLYVADEDNPAFLGPAPIGELADHIAGAHGPSGSNREYVVQLAEALRDLGDEDPHVLALDELLSETD
jgi:cation transport regulator ChaC